MSNLSKKIIHDLKTFNPTDIQTLYKYYKCSDLSCLAKAIYNGSPVKAKLPPGTIFDAIDRDNYENFLEFVNDPSFDKNATSNGITPLIYILSRNKKVQNEYIKKLIEKGVDINEYKSDNYSPLIYAISNSLEHNNIEVVELLLKAGANPNIRKETQDQTPLEFVIQRFTFEIYEMDIIEKIIRLLLNYGAQVTLQSIKVACKLTPKYKKTKLLDLLIKGKNLSSIDLTGIDVECREYIITKLKTLLQPFFKNFSSDELQYVNENCDLNTVSGIYKCLDMAENMYEYHPSNEKAEELGKKYKEHPYFQPKK